MKILKKMTKHFLKEGMTNDDVYNCISEDTKYDTIRLEEPDLFQYKPLPLIQFIMPTFGKKTLIRENKSLGLEKMAQPSMSLNNFYFMRDPATDHNRLQSLKMRHCRNTKDVQQVMERREKARRLNQMVFFDKYNDLQVFECTNMKILVQVLFAILDYNR